MSKRFSSVIALLFVAVFAHAQSRIEYHFPMDGSRYVPATSQIILRVSEPIDLEPADVTVAGDTSGVHAGSLRLSDDGRTYLFTPSESFAPGEAVHVSVAEQNPAVITPLFFSFQVQTDEQPNVPFLEPVPSPSLSSAAKSSSSKEDHIESVPDDFPVLTVGTNNNPAPGDIFLTSYKFDATGGAYRIVVDSLANPLYYAKPSKFTDWDFKPTGDGRYSFLEGGYSNAYLMAAGSKCYIMDSSLSVVDNFNATTSSTPYTTDFHDFELLPHNHALMLALATVPHVDMSQYVKGGNKNATILGAVIEELDSLKNPIWIWRSWDSGHYLDTDATNDPFTEDTIDAVHANAMQVDTDGNILLSARSMDEITKINRMDANGSLMWRFGGKHNQFTFVGDSIHFSHQHALRRIPNGDLTLFDNGNFHQVNITIINGTDTETYFQTFARACEYRLNMQTM
ncbi:MAG TPA: aryl-sulfate sulfotransferase, partial [Candidatus Kapabacteria bacterium]